MRFWEQRRINFIYITGKRQAGSIPRNRLPWWQGKALSMDSRAVLITGCSSGIGLCVAQGLQQRGYRVFATARKAADVGRLQAQGLESVRLDLADSGSIREALAEVLGRSGGRLFALFNNGAYGQPGAEIGRASCRERV